MSILSGLMGNAAQADLKDIKEDYGVLLGNDEELLQAYKWIRDAMLFTNRRLIMIEVQGATGKKVDYHSVPYKHIRHFSVESAGPFDLDAELKIWVAGMGADPIVKTFSKDADVYRVQALLAQQVGK